MRFFAEYLHIVVVSSQAAQLSVYFLDVKSKVFTSLWDLIDATQLKKENKYEESKPTTQPDVNPRTLDQMKHVLCRCATTTSPETNT